MEFRILGPLDVRDNGRTVTLGGPKQRALLAVLLVNANRPVSVDRLVDALWGEHPPPTAAATVHVYVSQLRKLLGRERLVTRRPGYALQVAPEEIDLARFERLVIRARRAEDPAERAGLLREALALWRGEPLGDIAYEPFVLIEAERLEETRRSAVEERIDAELALGASGELVPELEQLVAEHPLRERLRAQLMLALYRSGRQAEALAAFQEARRSLVEELGLEPSPDLQELERQILNQDPSLQPPPTMRPGPPSSVTEPSDLREERKLVTVLFADLVGFTQRAEQLDPEDVRALLRRFHQPIRAGLERFGGSIEKFVGDAVMAVFGAPVAHEDDADRAVRAAFAVRDAIAGLRAEDPQFDLELRIGINTGSVLAALDADVAAGEGMVVGDVVNTAARLQAAAPVNGILVGEATRRATEQAIEYRKARPVRAKGKAESVRAWEAVRERLPIGERRPPPSYSPLVGREAELALLREALELVRRDRAARVVTLVGPPGIGKTRLVAELREAEAGRVNWLLGRSLSYGDGLPFFALAQIVKAHAGILETDSAETAAVKLERALPEALEEEAGWVSSHLRLLVGLESERAGDRREAFAAWRRFLEALAEREPLVVVLEDVHWADEGLLDFVAHVAEWARGPLLVICAARPELLERRPEWDSLPLRPLSEEESGRLLDELLAGAALTPEARGAVVGRVSGNPLYIEEFARTLASRPETAVDSLPEAVQGVISARIDALPAREKAVVHDAAVLGKVFWPGALASLAQLERGVILERLGALERKELLRREPRSSVGSEEEFAFGHVLVRDVAYEQIPRVERADRHRLAAEWLRSLSERADERAELVAYHYSSALDLSRAAGLPADHLVDPTVEFLTLAGDRARRLHAYGEAIDALERALRLVGETGPAAAPILLILGQALQTTGRFAEAHSAFQRALAVAPSGDDVRLATLYRLLAGTCTSEYRYTEAESVYEAAEAVLEPFGNDEERWREWIRVQTDRLMLLYWQQDPERMTRLIERAEPIVERWGTPAQRAEFLAAHYLVRLAQERYVASDETLELSRRFLAARKALGDPVDIARAQFNVGFVRLTRGELDDAQPALESALETGDRTANAILRCRSLIYLGTLHRRRRDLDETRRLTQRALEAVTETRMSEYVGLARANLAWVAWIEGDVERADAEGRAALEAFAQSAIGVFPWEWTARFPLLAVALQRRQTAEARRQARALLDVRQQPLGEELEAALAGSGRNSLERALELAEADRRL
jgi:DNA-binding SARP family transcriptional activator